MGMMSPTYPAGMLTLAPVGVGARSPGARVTSCAAVRSAPRIVFVGVGGLGTSERYGGGHGGVSFLWA